MLINKIQISGKCFRMDADISVDKANLFKNLFKREGVVVNENTQNPFDDHKIQLFTQTDYLTKQTSA